MKKSGIIVGFLATAFGLAVVNKMHKMNTNKDSVKGKAKEVAGKVIGNEQMQAEGTFDQVIGASKEVLEDLNLYQVLQEQALLRRYLGKQRKL